MILKTDCKFFPGDRPCIFNKTQGIKCDSCRYYDPVGYKILIIKLDAVGDVLRTTSILAPLKRKYPDGHITWLTRQNAMQIFYNNPNVDQVLVYEETSTIALLETTQFDLVINTDASYNSSSLASISNSKNKKGFVLNPKGRVISANPESNEWFEMGAFDEYKKRNTKTYQQIIHELIGLEYRKDEIQIFLSESEKHYMSDFHLTHNLQKYDFVVGLNTGAGSRWQFKQWTIEGYIELIDALRKKYNAAFLLYGGPEEIDRNNHLKKIFPFLIDTGTDNNLREFFSKLDLVDVFITGDTMALHAAAALKKKIVCVFGPTSSDEIEDYGRIIKILPALDCLVCYKSTCDFVPNCMESIKYDMILDALETHLKNIKN